MRPTEVRNASPVPYGTPNHPQTSKPDTPSRHATRRSQQNAPGRLQHLGQPEPTGEAFAGIPWADKFKAALNAVAKLSSSSKQLSETKAELDEALANFNHRIIVMIDDIDRLESREISEILRLVPSVADFSNIVYVLCYDGEILANAINESMKIRDGHTYIEKIIQIEIPVPRPEPFALRQMFRRGLAAIERDVPEEVAQRLTVVVDREGGRRLETPRALNRVLDALRFLWPPLKGDVELADLAWLQLVRSSNNRLYRWIEQYSAEMAAVAGGRATVPEIDRQRIFCVPTPSDTRKLLDALDEGFASAADLLRTWFGL